MSSSGGASSKAPQQQQQLEFDHVLKTIGEFGRYQKVRFWLLNLSAAVIYPFTLYSFMFMSFTPKHRCFYNQSAAAATNQANRSAPYRSSEAKLLQLRTSNVTIRACSIDFYNDTDQIFRHECDRWEFDSEYRTLVSEWEMVCARGWQISLIGTISQVAQPLGIFIFSYLLDNVGRKWSFMIMVLVNVVPGIGVPFSPNRIVFMVLRFVQVTTMIAGWQVPFILALEIVGPNYRTFVTNVMCVCFAIGAATVSPLAYLCRRWQQLSLVTTLPFIGFLFYWFVLDESPRWLQSKNKIDEWQTVVKKIAKQNQTPISHNDLTCLLRSPRDANRNRKRDVVLSKTVRRQHQPNRRVSVALAIPAKPKIIDLFKTKNIRAITLILTYLYAVNNVVYYGLALNVEHLAGNRFVNFFFMMIMEAPAALINSVLLERIGRIWPMACMMTVGGLAPLAIVWIPRDQVALIAVFAAISKFGISGSFAILVQLAGELFPTEIRGLGSGFCITISGIMNIPVPFLVYSAHTFKWLPLVTMGILSLVGALLTLFLPETMHTIMPETISEVEQRSNVSLRTLIDNFTLKSLKTARRRKITALHLQTNQKYSDINDLKDNCLSDNEIM